MRSRLIYILSALITFVLSPAAADSGDHGPHTHGVAELTLALEGRKLEIVLSSPAISVVGFEHEASTPEQRDAVAEVQATLLAATNLFTFKGTQCALQKADVDVSAVSGNTTRPSREDNQGGEDGVQHHKGSHSDIGAHYEYSCTDGAELEAIGIGAAGLPFGLERINAMWVTDRSQGGSELTAKDRLIQFK